MNYYIINPQSGKALDVNRGGNANGTNIHLWERNQSGAQKWVIHADGIKEYIIKGLVSA